MIVVGLVLIGMFLVGMYYFAVFALPAIVGIWVFFWAMNNGAGLGSAIAGIVAGVAVYLAGQLMFSYTRNFPMRLLMMAAFGVPAALLSYNAILQLSEAVIPSPVWRHVFAVPGGIVIGFIAISRVIAAPTPRPRPAKPLTALPPVES
jgi:hypothetical protein